MQTWTFGPAGIYTATWDGISKVTVTLTAGGAFVASFFARSLEAAVASPEYQAILAPAPSLAVSDYMGTQNLASGETVIPRLNVITGAALVSQQMQLSYWTALRSETVNTLIANTGSTAAGATPTYCAMGVYQVNSDSSLTLLGQCANDTTLFGATFTSYSRAATAAFSKVQGQRYAFAVLVVSAAAMPALTGYNGAVVLSSTAPRVTGQVTGQSSLPASVASGSIASTASMYFGAVTP